MPLLSGAVPQTRYWYWRGWKIRYQVLLAAQPQDDQAPLLLLHGFGASLEQWRDNGGALARHRTVYALDLLGFGASQKAATLFTVDLWSEQVHDFWRCWIGGPMVLMGHSLGALVALNTAVTYPSTVERLIMLTLPAAREELLTGWIGALSGCVEQVFSTPLLIRPLFRLAQQSWLIRGALGGIYQAKERVDDALVRQFVQPTSDRGAARTFCYLVRSRTELQFSPETKKLIPRLGVPGLLLWGKADRIIPVAWGEQVAPLNPQVQLVILPGVGHCLYDDDPELVNQQVLSWLASSAVSPGG